MMSAQTEGEPPWSTKEVCCRIEVASGSIPITLTVVWCTIARVAGVLARVAGVLARGVGFQGIPSRASTSLLR